MNLTVSYVDVVEGVVVLGVSGKRQMPYAEYNVDGRGGVVEEEMDECMNE